MYIYRRLVKICLFYILINHLTNHIILKNIIKPKNQLMQPKKIETAPKILNILKKNNDQSNKKIESHNPIANYLNILYEISMFDKTLFKYIYDFKNIIKDKKFFKIIKSYELYEIDDDEKELENFLLSDELEKEYKQSSDNHKKFMSEEEINIFLKDIRQSIMNSSSNFEEVISYSIENFYFSKYTQNILLAVFYYKFLQGEEAEELNNVFEMMVSNYENNKYIPWMQLLLIINYYENSSLEGYDNNVNILSSSQELCNNLLDNLYIKYQYYHYNNIEEKFIDKKNIFYIQKLKFYLEIIFLQKEFYKYKNMIHNGEIEFVIPLFRNSLISMRNGFIREYFNNYSSEELFIWNNRINIFSIENYHVFSPFFTFKFLYNNTKKEKSNVFEEIKNLDSYDFNNDYKNSNESFNDFFQIYYCEESIIQEILIDHEIIKKKYYDYATIIKKHHNLNSIANIQIKTQSLKKNFIYKIYIDNMKLFKNLLHLLKITDVMDFSIM